MLPAIELLATASIKAPAMLNRLIVFIVSPVKLEDYVP
jgi:hypothetical protein